MEWTFPISKILCAILRIHGICTLVPLVHLLLHLISVLINKWVHLMWSGRGYDVHTQLDQRRLVTCCYVIIAGLMP